MQVRLDSSSFPSLKQSSVLARWSISSAQVHYLPELRAASNFYTPDARMVSEIGMHDTQKCILESVQLSRHPYTLSFSVNASLRSQCKWSNDMEISSVPL